MINNPYDLTWHPQAGVITSLIMGGLMSYIPTGS